MAAYHERFPYELVITLGDNLYGSQGPKDFQRKFAIPYKPLLDRGVRFYATLGNHDRRTNRFYEHWNMNGELYYTYAKKNVRFFALDTETLDVAQREWLERELSRANERWKIRVPSITPCTHRPGGTGRTPPCGRSSSRCSWRMA